MGNTKQKIFIIGSNKTGTTSLETAIRSFGFKIGSQAEGELLIEDWARRDFRRIIAFCNTAQAFQDIPFSLDYTYQVLDYAFPESKFILTMRNSSEEWYESLIRFHTKIIGTRRLPTADDLKKFPYRYKGWLWRVQQLVYGIDESGLYDKALYIKCYEMRNSRILEYFRYRAKDLLTLKLSDPSAMGSLCAFLGVGYEGQVMPHVNRSA